MQKRKPRIHRLAFLGAANELAELASKGVPIDGQNWENSLTPLRLAVDEGHLEAVQVLLVAGADPSRLCGYFHDCALHTAAYRGFTEIAAILIRAGTPVNVLDRRRWTPLHNAAEGGPGTLTVAKLLIESGADICALDEDLYTPLHLSALSQDLSVANLLLSLGADPLQRNAFDQTALDVAMDQYEALPKYASGRVKTLYSANAKNIRDLIRFISTWKEAS